MDWGLEILTGDCRDILPTLAAGGVQCCVTSPPYWGLRDYGTAQWEGGEAGCDHVETWNLKRDHSGGLSATNGNSRGNQSSTTSSAIQYRNICKCGARRIDSQLGLEATPEEYIAKMVAVFREVWRVLRDDGTLWVNMGDSYAGGNQTGNYPSSKSTLTTNNGRGPKEGDKYSALSWRPGNPEKNGGQSNRDSCGKVPGLKPKDLCMMPARLAMALQADGWYLRSEIVWHKPNPMPESVTDRPSKAHEMIYLLAKRQSYFYDAEAIREPHIDINHPNRGNGERSVTQGLSQGWCGNGFPITERNYDPNGRNKRSVWTIPTQPYAQAHFATFPEEIPKLCILAGSKPGDTVLDPFMGSGTTLKVALELGRKAIGIELNADYIEMAKQRCDTTPGLPLSSNSPFSCDTLGIDQSDSKESWLLPEFENLGKV